MKNIFRVIAVAANKTATTNFTLFWQRSLSSKVLVFS
jgi:hypothetical protein